MNGAQVLYEAHVRPVLRHWAYYRAHYRLWCLPKQAPDAARARAHVDDVVSADEARGYRVLPPVVLPSPRRGACP